MIRYLILLFLLLSPAAMVEEIVAIIDLKFLKDTDAVASTLCFEGSEADNQCATWAAFYLFEVRVKKVVSGDPEDRKFLVWFGSHALKKGNIKNMLAKLKPFSRSDSVLNAVC